ncbi:optic atrophy 3 protein (OPA3) domain-containing protein [Phthorimaea operculella]|nr:optic atrophy 3 protein (OPA3) domain-containing protein [Phthorimaea operculella]
MSSTPFPMFKLATLIARQLSAPIATRVKNYAKRHPLFSRVICTTTAELYREPYSYQILFSVPGEIVIFLIGCSIITFEFNRQAMIKEKVEEDERVAWGAVKALLEETRHEVQRQQQVIDRLNALLRDHLAYSGGGGHQGRDDYDGHFNDSSFR